MSRSKKENAPLTGIAEAALSKSLCRIQVLYRGLHKKALHIFIPFQLQQLISVMARDNDRAGKMSSILQLEVEPHDCGF